MKWLSPEPNVDCAGFDGNSGMCAFNVYNYCSNNPVIYYDSTGESLTIVIFGVTLGIKEILLLLAGLTTATMVVGNTAAEDLWGGSKWTVAGSKHRTKQRVETSIAIAQPLPNYKRKNEWHHIVAKKAPQAQPAYSVLKRLDIKINSYHNLVLLKTEVHRRLHTHEYYGMVNAIIIYAERAGNNNREDQKRNVLAALNGIKDYLRIINMF